jgi:hypothetical protein
MTLMNYWRNIMVDYTYLPQKQYPLDVVSISAAPREN